MMTRLALALVALLGLAAPAHAQKAVPPEIRANGEIWLGNAAKLGKRETGKTIITPDTLQILGSGSTGNISDMNAAPTAGGTPRSLKDLLSNEVYAANFGVVADDGLDDGPALREAIRIAQLRRARLRLPGGVINICTDPADAEALLRITSVMDLAGASRGTTIMPCATAGDRAVALIKPPTNGGGIRGMVLRDFTIGTLGQTRFGGDGIKIDTTNTGGFVAKLLVENVGVADAGAGYWSVRHVNTSAANFTGGLFGSTFRDNDFAGGMKFELTGDSNNIERNIIFGPNTGVDYQPIAGAATHRIVGNNITARGGAIIVRNGAQVKVDANQCEQTGAYTGPLSTPAMVAFIGTVDWMVRDNNLNAGTYVDVVSATSGATGGVLGPNSVTYDTAKFLYNATGSPGNLVERQRREVVGGVLQTGNSRISLDVASITLGVWQQLTPQNGWVDGTDANFRNGLWWMPLSDGTVRMAGTIKPGTGATVAPGTSLATFPAGYRVSNKAVRLMATGLNNSVPGLYSIVLNTAGGLTIESAAPNNFYQFDGMSFSVRQ